MLADENSASIKVAKYSGKNKCDLIENEKYGFCSLIKATERVLDKLGIENKTFTKITGATKRLERKMINMNKYYNNHKKETSHISEPHFIQIRGFIPYTLFKNVKHIIILTT